MFHIGNKQGSSTFMRMVISLFIAVVIGGSLFGGFMALSKGPLGESLGSVMEREANPSYSQTLPRFGRSVEEAMNHA